MSESEDIWHPEGVLWRSRCRCEAEYVSSSAFFWHTENMKHALLTVPLQYATADDLSKVIKTLPEEVEAYEVWIDHLLQKELNPYHIDRSCREWKKLSQKKMIIVCKAPKEKGKYKGTQEQLQELLQAAAKGGADYIDLDLDTDEKTLLSLRKSLKKTQLIVSHHDFEKTPEIKALEKILEKMRKTGADVLKLATMVHDPKDTERLMELAMQLKEEKQKHIILGMGQLGVTTRIFSDSIGNELNFVTLESKTAPGQLSLEQAVQFRAVIE